MDANEFFASSFETLTGYKPMPWQSRLFRTHFLSGNLPSAISIPTGLGKTAVMAIWLIALAWQCRESKSPTLARRLVYVVDRRAVVDQSTDFAEGLRKRLTLPEAAELRSALGLVDGQKLAISTLRGQFVDNREWLEDPSLPAVLVGTVDMVGSRLLFEGYGVSRKMRPYHAGLLGADALVLLDEAHLVPPFEALLTTIAKEPEIYAARNKEDRQRIPSFKLLPLSATNRASGEGAFILKEQDYDDPDDEGARLTLERLGALKRLHIETASGKDLTKAIAEYAWKISDQGANDSRYLIYCDRRDDAQAVFNDLLGRLAKRSKTEMKKTKGEDNGQYEARISATTTARIELFVGARRVYERMVAQERLETLGFLANSDLKPDSATFLVATSAGEVGVDLDADYMICDLVAWERMVQRFGRVNRRGKSSSDIVVVAAPPKAPTTKLPEVPQLDVLVEPSKPQPKSKKPGKKATPEESRAFDEAMDKLQRENAEFKEASKQFKDISATQARAKGDYRAALTKFHEDWAETNLHNVRVALLKRLDGDASPFALLKLLANAAADPELMSTIQVCSEPASLRPALTRPLVDAWSMTSLEEHTGRPRVDPWLRGWVNDLPQTVVAWREHLPVRGNPPVGRKEIKDVEAFFEAAPVQTVERLETETWRVLDWLQARIADLLQGRSEHTPYPQTEGEGTAEGEVPLDKRRIESDENNEAASDIPDAGDSTSTSDSTVDGRKLKPDDIIGMIFSADGDYQRTLVTRDIPTMKPDGDAQKKRHKAAVEQLEKELSGATLVLRADLGGLESGLLKKEVNALVPAADGSASWGKGGNDRPLIPFRIHDSVTSDTPLDGEWREAFRFDLKRNDDGDATRWLVVEEWPDSVNTEDRRSNGPEQSLTEHQSWAARCARQIGDRLGLEHSHVEMLAVAACLHDEGKQAKRWQNAFRASGSGRPFAKTKGPIDFKLLDGYRHEFGSLPYAQENAAFQKLPPDLQDLALHLIAAHHGFARPVIATNGCEYAPPSALEARAREVALRFARLQRRWGPWGLAWWEALLRAADQQASRENDARGRQSTKRKKR